MRLSLERWGVLVPLPLRYVLGVELLGFSGGVSRFRFAPLRGLSGGPRLDRFVHHIYEFQHEERFSSLILDLDADACQGRGDRRTFSNQVACERHSETLGGFPIRKLAPLPVQLPHLIKHVEEVARHETFLASVLSVNGVETYLFAGEPSQHDFWSSAVATRLCLHGVEVRPAGLVLDDHLAVDHRRAAQELRRDRDNRPVLPVTCSRARRSTS